MVANGRRLPYVAPRLESEFQRRLGDRFLGLYVTRSAGSAGALAAQAVEDGADAVLAVGGDGTFHEVLQGAGRSDAAVGVLPTGSGNDFAFHMGMHGAFDEMVGRLPHAEVVPIDRLEVNDRVIATAVGWGVPVSITRDAERVRGHFPNWDRLPKAVKGGVYQIAAAAYLIRDPDEPFQVELTHDGGSRRSRAAAVLLGDSRRIGGAFLAFPDARKHDGVANLCVLEHKSWSMRAMTLGLLRFGLHQARPGVHVLTTRKATLDFDRPLPWIADGEFMPPASHFEAAVLPDGLRLLLPRP